MSTEFNDKAVQIMIEYWRDNPTPFAEPTRVMLEELLAHRRLTGNNNDKYLVRLISLHPNACSAEKLALIESFKKELGIV